MKNIKVCRNKCIFCFVDQLPGKLRPALYIKDDDFLSSFTDGNFVTLTNVSNADLGKIIKFEIEPLYVSVHSLNEKIRDRIFNHKQNMVGLKNLRTLDKNNIKTNIQIVLCPGINDGADLVETLNGLLSGFKNIVSVGIVPVGITKFRSRKSLNPFDKKNALKTIESVARLKILKKSVIKSWIIYLSDEFYLLADMDFPAYKSYGGFHQLKNGIGKSTEFFRQVKDALRSMGNAAGLKRFISKKVKILIVTSAYGEIIINKTLNMLRAKKYITKKDMSCIEVLMVKNMFFGGNIKATGLLAGSDIISNLGKIDLNKYRKILIPGCIFNYEDLTLDNFSRKHIESLNMNIKIIPDDGINFIKHLVSRDTGE